MQLLDLPRELRDMIYMAIIGWKRPRLTLQDTSSNIGWESVNMSGHVLFSAQGKPSTFANFLAVNRQINKEMGLCIDRARRKGMMSSQIDCIARDDSLIYFSWLSIPIVHTRTTGTLKVTNKMLTSWAPKMPVMKRLLAATLSGWSMGGGTTTSIEQLQIDIRLFGNYLAKPAHFGFKADRTSWAICAALKGVLERDPSVPGQFSTRDCFHQVIIDTLILQVISPEQLTREALDDENSAGASQQTDNEDEPDIYARVLGRQLVNVWNKLWSGAEFHGKYYHNLLERIKRVRVLVDGTVIGERELGLELERGQKERRRIAQRVGW